MPRGSKYVIFTYMLHKHHRNVGKYALHGSIWILWVLWDTSMVPSMVASRKGCEVEPCCSWQIRQISTLPTPQSFRKQKTRRFFSTDSAFLLGRNRGWPRLWRLPVSQSSTRRVIQRNCPDGTPTPSAPDRCWFCRSSTATKQLQRWETLAALGILPTKKIIKSGWPYLRKSLRNHVTSPQKRGVTSCNSNDPSGTFAEAPSARPAPLPSEPLPGNSATLSKAGCSPKGRWRVGTCSYYHLWISPKKKHVSMFIYNIFELFCLNPSVFLFMFLLKQDYIFNVSLQ